MNEKIWFIILNYNNYTDTCLCVESIFKNKKSYKIIIVDNNSTDESQMLLKEKYPQCIHLFCKSNDGYAAGNNAGIKYALRHGAEYVCIMNNDVVIPENFVENALNAMTNRKDCGILSPIICEYDNRDYVQSAGAMISLYKGMGPLLHYHESVDNVNVSTDNPDYLGGACLIVRKEIFNRNGLLPEFYFLFYEETDWFFKARRRGIKFSCDASIRCYHKGSASVNEVQGLKGYYMTRNQVVFERRNANLCQFAFYLIYTICRYLYSFIKGRRNIFQLKAFWDGLWYDWKEIEEK